MDGTTARYIHSSQLLKESLFSPHPVNKFPVTLHLQQINPLSFHSPPRRNAVDDRVEEGEDAVRFEVAAFSHCPADYGRSGCGEGELKEEGSENGSHQRISDLWVDEEVTDSDEWIRQFTATVREAVAKDPVRQALQGETRILISDSAINYFPVDAPPGQCRSSSSS